MKCCPIAGVLPHIFCAKVSFTIATKGVFEMCIRDRSGTVSLHNVNWKADYLANHVEIAQATLRLDTSGENGAIPVSYTHLGKRVN